MTRFVLVLWPLCTKMAKDSRPNRFDERITARTKENGVTLTRS
jgi:hypothetical protein